MGVDYAIMHPPPPDDALGAWGRFDLLKTRRLFVDSERRVRESGDMRPLSEIAVQRVVLRNGNEPEIVPTTLQEMKEAARKADAMVAEAGPTAVYERGYVAYPIPSNVEEWVMSLFPKDIDSPVGVSLRTLVEEAGIDGGRVVGMRAAGRQFFPRRKPVRRVWQTARGDWGLTSDQAFEMLFGRGSMEPDVVAWVALVFGLMSFDLSPAEVQAALEEPATREPLLRRAIAPKPPDSAADLIGFFLTLQKAAALDATLWIDG